MTAKVVAIPIEAAMKAAIMVTKLGTAKFVTMAELTTIPEMVTTHAIAVFFSASYRRCRNGNGGQGCERNTKFSHVRSSRWLPKRKRWNSEPVPTLAPSF
jgi:hypothetical protein